MLAVERRKIILEKVHTEKKVIVSELSKEFEVSEETIRRDLPFFQGFPISAVERIAAFTRCFSSP